MEAGIMEADIIACYPTSWFSYLIQKITKKDITHIAISIDDKYVMETSYNGIKMSKLEDVGKYKILRCKYLTYAQKKGIVEYVKDKVDVKYDFILILNIFLEKLFRIDLDWHDKQRLICVELVINAYKSQGIDLLPDIEFDDIVPGDLDTSKELEEVKE
jgi:hypothetical protein